MNYATRFEIFSFIFFSKSNKKMVTVHDLDFMDCCLSLLTALNKFEILEMVVINYLLEINGDDREEETGGGRGVKNQGERRVKERTGRRVIVSVFQRAKWECTSIRVAPSFYFVALVPPRKNP